MHWYWYMVNRDSRLQIENLWGTPLSMSQHLPNPLPKSAKRSTFSHKMGQKRCFFLFVFCFCRRGEVWKVHLWVQKVKFLGIAHSGPYRPKLDPGYGPSYVLFVPSLFILFTIGCQPVQAKITNTTNLSRGGCFWFDVILLIPNLIAFAAKAALVSQSYKLVSMYYMWVMCVWVEV